MAMIPFADFRVSSILPPPISRNDFIVAAALDDVKVDYSPKWLKENPAAASTAK